MNDSKLQRCILEQFEVFVLTSWLGWLHMKRKRFIFKSYAKQIIYFPTPVRIRQKHNEIQ